MAPVFKLLVGGFLKSKCHQKRIEPDWAPSRRLSCLKIPLGTKRWLTDTGSLTARLKSHCPKGFRVRVVSQDWGRPLVSEQRFLGMRHGELAIIREVELLCYGRPWVFARTLIPAKSLRGSARRLAYLGDRPLGEVLFADPHMRRGEVQMAHITQRHRLFAKATQHLRRADEIWGRRSLFELAGNPLLVNEIFLPNIPERP